MSDPLPLVIANLKANQTWDQMSIWLEEVGPRSNSFSGTVIVCPTFAFLASSAEKIKTAGWKLKLAGQDISKFEQGAYTGEVAASQIADIIQYSIVGHSERRKYFNETADDAIKKVKTLLVNNITPILCVSDLKQLDVYLTEGSQIIENSGRIIFVYEPPTAISSGREYKPERPENANEKAQEIRQKIGQKVSIIYGGSINPENVKEFFTQDNLDGGLIGQASVDPQIFIQVIQNSIIQ